MKNKYIYILIFLAIVIAGLFIFFNFNNNDTNNLTNISGENTLANLTNKNEIKEDKATKEVELSSFSTYLGWSTEGRKTNIKITCGKLNGTIVKANQVFSFNDIVGQVTEEDGYQEADVISHGEIIQALGGGNCQVSSTLYNVVLAIPEFEVIERHSHDKDVGYVELDKDATISYDTLDFKFKNNFQEDIKLYFSSDDENITVKAVKLIKER